jgi:alkylation response protein AidB-like acyl-CoA dehydrogenase
MPLGLTQDDAALADLVLAVAARAADRDATRRALDTLAAGSLPAAWGQLVAGGLLAVSLPESLGGGGGHASSAAVVLEAAGRALVPGPVTSTVLAGLLAGQGGGECADLLGRRIAAGAPTACALGADAVTAERTAGGYRLAGSTGPVLDAPAAELLIVGARDGGDERWFVIEAGTDGMAVQPLAPVDLTRSLGRVSFTGAELPDSRLLKVSSEQVRALAAVAFAAESAGVARWCLDTALAYVKIREQFGRPVGSFQAVKHKLALLFLRLELMTAAAWDAARAAGEAGQQLRLAAAAAAVICVPGARDLALDTVTTLGGIGFTWEHDISLYWRRATATAQLFGNSSGWAVRLGHLAGIASRDFAVTAGDEDPGFRAEVADALTRAAALSGAERRHALADAGLVAPHYPAPYGRNATPAQQLIVSEEYERAGLPAPRTDIGEYAMPTILAHGSDRQRERFISPTLRGEITWCQLFSEPGAGSDLASLRTTAIKVDGGWRLNGQKVWNSLAAEADWGICLARTDTSVPKHKGISYFLVDMDADGVDVRPLRQTTGRAEFNEVFLNDVFIPDECLLGSPGDGWRLTGTTLANERLSIASNDGATALDKLRELAKAIPEDQGAMVTLGRLTAESHAIHALHLRATLRGLQGLQPGAESSVAKLATTELRRAQMQALIELAGPDAAEFVPDDRHVTLEYRAPVDGYLALPTILIGGGTREIQLNVIAERVLGLPRG